MINLVMQPLTAEQAVAVLAALTLAVQISAISSAISSEISSAEAGEEEETVVP